MTPAPPAAEPIRAEALNLLPKKGLTALSGLHYRPIVRCSRERGLNRGWL
jgi:hypothetical protein